MLKRKLINLKDARKAIDIYDKIRINYEPVNLDSSLVLCDKFKIYAYDAYIIDCALKNKLPLFSLDKKLIEI